MSLDPAILFFLFGVFAGLVRSNLEIPQPISRFLSLYLLMALGLKGGFALAETGFTAEVALSLSAGVILAIVVPLLTFALLRNRIHGFDAAALAATYGSVSAVTFITATQMLDAKQIAYGGHMAATMALMEAPAIILAVLFANHIRQSMQRSDEAARTSLKHVLHESLTDGAQMLIIGAMLIGWFSGAKGEQVMAPFSVDLFKGMLAFFLLDMGLLAARNLASLRGVTRWLFVYAIFGPLTHAGLAWVLARTLGLNVGDTTLLMVLAASASYIAVPAALRHAIPEAKPALYFGLSLGVTFPFNILIGIPLYQRWAQS